jgi:hypothetical protein
MKMRTLSCSQAPLKDGFVNLIGKQVGYAGKAQEAGGPSAMLEAHIVSEQMTE